MNLSYCELLHYNSLNLLNTKIVNGCQSSNCIFTDQLLHKKELSKVITFITFITEYFRQFQNLDICEVCISETALRKLNQCEI